jgi:hypothetical protein
MYRQVETHKTARRENGCEITPLATLEDEAGGRVHIEEDDHCYVLSLERRAPDGTVFCKPTPYIFPEAHAVLRSLPSLTRPICRECFAMSPGA